MTSNREEKIHDSIRMSWLLLLLAGGLLVSSMPVIAQDSLIDSVGLNVTLGTADIYRGMHRNDRTLALQVGAKLQFEHISVGVSVHDAQFSSTFGGTSEELEIDYYIGYAREVSEHLAWQLQFKTYTFPGSSNAFFEYNYNELALNLELPAGLSWSVSASDTNFSFAGGTAYSEVAWRQALPFGYEFSAGLGGVKLLSRSRTAYAYWDLGVSRVFKSLAIDLRYHSTPFERTWFGRQPASSALVVSLTKGWSY